MKRFVTYLYECERGNKTKNVGFIRVNVRGGETTMEIYLRNIARAADKGKLFVLIDKKNSEPKELLGIELTEVCISNGQSDTRIVVETENINEQGVTLSEILGVGIYLDSGLYIASCWKDEHVDEIVRGEFSREEQKKEFQKDESSTEIQNELVAAEDTAVSDNTVAVCEKHVVSREEKLWEKRTPTYERIDLSQIRELPSPNWHLTTNSFLVHGFWNYGYLVLKKEMAEGEEILSLGVPGIFEKPEAVMAVLFGFPSFEAIPSEIDKKAKNQEAEAGTFGCWFVNLKE